MNKCRCIRGGGGFKAGDSFLYTEANLSEEMQISILEPEMPDASVNKTVCKSEPRIYKRRDFRKDSMAILVGALRKKLQLILTILMVARGKFKGFSKNFEEMGGRGYETRHFWLFACQTRFLLGVS